MKITVSSVPTTSEEFSALPQNDLSKPENTCTMFLLALALYLKDSNAGVAALNTLRGPRPLSNYDIQFLRDRLHGKAIFRLLILTVQLRQTTMFRVLLLPSKLLRTLERRISRKDTSGCF